MWPLDIKGLHEVFAIHLSHFMPLVSYNTPWKLSLLIFFRVYKKRSVAWDGLRFLELFIDNIWTFFNFLLKQLGHQLSFSKKHKSGLWQMAYVRTWHTRINFTNYPTWWFFNKYAHEQTFSVSWVRETTLGVHAF